MSSVKPCPERLESNIYLLSPELEPDILLRTQIGCSEGASLRFFSATGTTLFSYADPDTLLSAYPVQPYSHLLLSVWEHGAYRSTRVFWVRREKVSLVLDETTKVNPEVITGAGDDVAIILSRASEKDPPWKITLADIYQWQGTQFKRLRTVAYEQRLTIAAKLLSAPHGNR